MKNLSLGSSGADVERLQQRLKDFGFYEGETSGEFDERTEESVKKFQESEGLAIDGLVGLMTRHELGLLKFEQVKLEED
jgi:N-acetylmuramoyl-L-alanine amidase